MEFNIVFYITYVSRLHRNPNLSTEKGTPKGRRKMRKSNAITQKTEKGSSIREATSLHLEDQASEVENVAGIKLQSETPEMGNYVVMN